MKRIRSFKSQLKNLPSKIGQRLNSSILDFLFSILKILWYPIEIIIHVLSRLVSGIRNRIINIFNDKEMDNKRLRKTVQKAIGASLQTQSNILSSYQSKRIARVFTLLLQLISFITTYAGFTFFLGELNPIAPLFLAIVIQGGCFYLMNYTSSNKRSGKPRRIILLFILVCISIITSYIGIFNSIVSPVTEMEDIYYNYKIAANDLLDKQIGKVYKEYTKGEIDNTYSYLETQIDSAKNEITALKAEQKKIPTTKEVPVDHFNYYYGYNYSDNQTVRNTEGETDRAKIDNKVTSLKGNVTAINQCIDNYKNEDIQKAYSELYENPESFNTECNQMDIYNSFQKAIAAAKRIDEYFDQETTGVLDLKLSGLGENDKTKAAYEGLKPDPFEDVSKYSQSDMDSNATVDESYPNFPDNFWNRFNKKVKNAFLKINDIFVPSRLSDAENIRNNIILYTKNNYRAISEKGLLDINENEELEKYINAYKKAYNQTVNIESPQVTAIVSPFKNTNTVGKAIFSLVIALIVDGVSLLIAFSLAQKKKSSLYYDDISKYRVNREEMLEECFMYICLNDIKNHSSNGKIVSSEFEIERMVANKMNDLMRGFLSKIHYYYFPDEFNAFGYISKNDYDFFSDEEQRLFITFCNISMIQAVNQTEILSIINLEFNENDSQTKVPEADRKLSDTYKQLFSANEIFYIVSKSLHVWICENFSELLQNTMLFYEDDIVIDDEHTDSEEMTDD